MGSRRLFLPSRSPPPLGAPFFAGMQFSGVRDISVPAPSRCCERGWPGSAFITLSVRVNKGQKEPRMKMQHEGGRHKENNK